MRIAPENNISLNGTIDLGSDKSLSIRAILFSSIAYGWSNILIKNPGEDTKTALKCIKKIGVKVIENKDTYKIFGMGKLPENQKQITIDCENSGTTLRLLSALIAGSNNRVKLIGDKSLSKRPIRINFLEKFLTNISAKKNKFLPAFIQGNPNSIQTNITIKHASAQMVSAAILGGLSAFGTSTIKCKNNLRDHTQRFLNYQKYPIKILNKKNQQIIKIKGKQFLKPLKNYNIPSDPSSASFIIAIAILTKGSEIKIKNVCLNKYRIKFISVLKRMGAKIKFINKKNYYGEPVGDIIAKYSPNLKGTNIKKNEVPGLIDEVLILSIVAMFCNSKSTFSNLEELKFKESNRLEMIYQNLKLCGAKIQKKKNSLIFNGLTEKFYSSEIPLIKTQGDHRLALSFFCFAAISRKKIIIDDINSIKVSFPNFLTIIKKIKTYKHRKIIVAADGGVAVGKTSILNKVQRYYGKKAITIDTGTIYRYITKIHLDSKSKKINTKYLIEKCKNISTQDLKNPTLHSNKISNNVSEIAKLPKIRNAILPLQRNIIFNSNSKIVLVGGRDINSKILPLNFSDLKLYFTASTNTRAKRRYKELMLKKNEKKIKFSDVLKELKKRDFSDKNRKYGKLKKTKDSVLLKNESSDIRRPVNKIVKMINLIEREIKKF